MSSCLVYTIQKNVKTGDVYLHQTSNKIIEDYARNRYKWELIKSPKMVEFGRISFAVSPSQDYYYETWMIPSESLSNWKNAYSEWVESCNPLPFVTYWYQCLLDGANRVISAIDPDGLLTSDFMRWLESDGKEGKNNVG